MPRTKYDYYVGFSDDSNGSVVEYEIVKVKRGEAPPDFTGHQCDTLGEAKKWLRADINREIKSLKNKLANVSRLRTENIEDITWQEEEY